MHYGHGTEGTPGFADITVDLSTRHPIPGTRLRYSPDRDSRSATHLDSGRRRVR